MSDHGELNDYLGEYLFGDLDAESRAHIEARIARDPELSARAKELRAMADTLEDIPRAAWEYVDDRTREQPQRPRARARRLRPRIAIGGLAGAMALAAAILLLVLGDSSSPSRRTVRLSALAGAPADSWATATITGSSRISISVLHLPPTDRRHHYELWLMTSPSDLVPVGSFRVSGAGRVEMSASLPAAPQRYRYLDISLQRDGAGTAISSTSLLRGPTSSS